MELAEEDEYRLETHPLCSEVMSLSDNDDEVRGSKQGGFNVTIAVVLFGGLSVVIVSRCCRTLSVVNESPIPSSSSLSTMVNSGIEQELEYCRIFSNSKSPCSFFDNADINDILRLGSFNFLDDTGSKEDDDELLEDSDEEVSLQIRLALLLLPIPLTILWRVASDDVINRRSVEEASFTVTIIFLSFIIFAFEGCSFSLDNFNRTTPAAAVTAAAVLDLFSTSRMYWSLVSSFRPPSCISMILLGFLEAVVVAGCCSFRFFTCSVPSNPSNTIRLLLDVVEDVVDEAR